MHGQRGSCRRNINNDIQVHNEDRVPRERTWAFQKSYHRNQIFGPKTAGMIQLTVEEFPKCKETDLSCLSNEKLDPNQQEEQIWLILREQQVTGTLMIVLVFHKWVGGGWGLGGLAAD